MRSWILSVALPLLAACAPSTGGGSLQFDAYAAGPESLPGDGTYAFDTPAGYHVELTRADLRVGAVYLNEQVPLPGAADRDCYLPGVYVAEVNQGVTVNTLNPAPQAFPEQGIALEERAYTGEVWLLGEGTDIDAAEDPHVIFAAAGTATRGDESWPFDASLSIGSNRRITPTDPKQPGDNPMCGERIVSPIPTNIFPKSGGALTLRIDPATFFRDVQFDQLEQVSDDPPLYRFRDVTDGQPNINVYRGLHSTKSAYSFSWE
ncbi:MAG: hypothetical protein H6718_23420 [Polyangiaceae bacterium]|nr:hypothetical protein [Polyangiaceae bacterium]